MDEGRVEQMVEKAAMALYDLEIRRLKEKVAAIPVPLDKIKKVLSEVREGSDRSTAILLFALVDDLLLFFFTRYLNPNIKGGLDTLLGGFGPLASAHGRLTMATSLRWVSDKTYANLSIIRRVRNIFAHETEVRQFEQEPVRGLVHSLEHYEKKLAPVLERGEVEQLTRPPTRDLFLVRGGLLVAHLVAELSIRRNAELGGLPLDALGFDDLPPNLKAIHLAISGHAIAVLAPTERAKLRKYLDP